MDLSLVGLERSVNEMWSCDHHRLTFSLPTVVPDLNYGHNDDRHFWTSVYSVFYKAIELASLCFCWHRTFRFSQSDQRYYCQTIKQSHQRTPCQTKDIHGTSCRCFSLPRPSHSSHSTNIGSLIFMNSGSNLTVRRLTSLPLTIDIIVVVRSTGSGRPLHQFSDV